MKKINAVKLYNFILKTILIIIHPFLLEGQVLSDDTYIKIVKNQKIKTQKAEIRINNKTEAKLGLIRVYFQKDDKVDISEVIITDTLGHLLRKISKDEIITKHEISDGSFYEDNFVKEIMMVWNKYPYHVKFSYTIVKKEFIQIANWYPILFYNVPTLSASLRVETPVDFNIMYYNDPDIEHRVEEKKDTKVYTWHAKNKVIFSDEILGQPIDGIGSSVVVNPELFHYYKDGSNVSWKDYGAWVHSLNTGLDQLTVNEKSTVSELVGSTKDTLKIIELLHEHRQKSTRYVNVSVKEGNLKPYPPGYVCTNRYGDCKALTMYMKALLKYFGIESYYTLVYAGVSPPNLNTSMPGHQFNHVILGIPLSHDTIWLENTAESFPPNYLGTFTQGRKALWVDGVNSKLIDLPELNYYNTGEITNHKYTIDTSQTTKFEISSIFKGAEFEKLTGIERQHNDEKNDLILDLLKLNKLKTFDLKYEISRSGIPSYHVKASGYIHNLVRKINKNFYFKVMETDLPNLEKPEKRKTDVCLSSPLYSLDSIVIHPIISDNIDIKFPKNINISSKFGQFSEGYQVLENSDILCVRKLMILKNKIPLSEYQSFFTFVEEIRESMKKSIIHIK
ncbi:MAG: DUF3857 domain-containing protein [Saprospiraceae bacterium]|jgi:hypothetical protein|nr:DUF3857 domain-containing protein [Saprospiraceae bacterium]